MWLEGKYRFCRVKSRLVGQSCGTDLIVAAFFQRHYFKRVIEAEYRGLK